MKQFMSKKLLFLLFLIAHPQPLSAMEDIFHAIDTNNLQECHGCIAKNPNALHDHRSHTTPLECALQKRNIPIFKYLLEQGACTHINNTTILQKTAVHGMYLPFLQCTLASDKLYDSFHITTRDKPDFFTMCFVGQQDTHTLSRLLIHDPTKAAWNQLIESSKQYLAFVQHGSNFVSNYTDQEKDVAGDLLYFASPTKQSLYEKGVYFYDNAADYSQWFEMGCPVSQKTIEVIGIPLIGCIALHKEFKTMAHEGYLTLDIILHVQKNYPKIYEYMLIVRNTENYTTLFNKLIENQEYEPAISILKSINSALEKHATIWAPYAHEIRGIKNRLQKIRTERSSRYVKMLLDKRHTDTHFAFV